MPDAIAPEEPGKILSSSNETKNGATSAEEPIEKPAADVKVEGDAKPDAKVEAKVEEKKPDPLAALVDDKWAPAEVKGLARDAEQTTKFRELAKELKLNAGQAQKLVELSDGFAKAASDAAMKNLDDTNAKWWGELRGDKDIGGAKFAESQQAANRVVRDIGGKYDLGKQLEALGLSNFPPLVRTFVDIGKQLAEDRLNGTVKDGAPQKFGPGEVDLVKAYPSMQPKES